MTLSRRQLLIIARTVAGVAVPATWPLGAAAQAYPARAVRVIVPVAAGGPTDVIARTIAQKLSEILGQSFYVENLPAGAGNVGMGVAARAPADGYTILFVSTNFVINPSLYARIPFDPVKSFAPVTLAAAAPHVLVVHPSVAARTVADLVALVKANPGKLSYASPGVGQSGQLAAELFRLALGLDLVHVPFNGGAPALISTLGGHTPIAFVALPPAASYIREGTLRALAVTGARRATEFPDVPTLAEAGVAGQESVLMQGMLVPAGTPPDIIDRLYHEVANILAMPDVRERLASLGFAPVVSTPDEFAAQISHDIVRWRKVIHDANIAIVE